MSDGKQPTPRQPSYAWLMYTTGDGNFQRLCVTEADVMTFLQEAIFGEPEPDSCVEAREIQAHFDNFMNPDNWSQWQWNLQFEDGGIHALRIDFPLGTTEAAKALLSAPSETRASITCEHGTIGHCPACALRDPGELGETKPKLVQSPDKVELPSNGCIALYYAKMKGALKELLRLYDWRNELGRIERDFNHNKKQMTTWLNQYGREKKQAWNVARDVVAGAGDIDVLMLHERIQSEAQARISATSATGADAAVQELSNIANAKRFDRTLFQDDEAFANWAQSRCRHTLSKYVGGEP